MPAALPRLLTLALAILAGLTSLVLGARLLVASPVGAMAIASWVDGARFGSAGEASLDGLRGDVLSGFAFDRFSLEAAEGEWLVIEDLSLDWRPLRYLTSGRLVIRELTARRVAVLSEPPSGESGGGSPDIPEFVVGRLDIAALELAEGLAGPEVILAVNSALESRAGGGLSLTARLERIDQPGDLAWIDAALDAEGRVEASVRAEGAAGGPFAALLRAPDSTVALTADVSGGREAGEGSGALRLDGQPVAEFTGEWGAGRFAASAGIDAATWPHRLLRRYIGGDAYIEVDGDFGDSVTLTNLRARMDGAEITARRAGEGWDADAEFSAARLSAWSGETITASSITWSGQVTTGETLSGTGQMRALEVGYRGFTARVLEGPLSIVREPDQYAISVEAASDGMTYPAEALGELLGPDPDIAARFDWISAERRLAFHDITIAGRSGGLDAAGAVSLADRSYTFDGEATLPDLSALADVTGEARSSLVLTGDFDGAVALSVDGRASELGGHPAFERLGRQVTLTANVNRTAQGQWRIERARARGDGLIARWTAEQDRQGRWSANGELALEAALDFGSVQMAGGAAAAFDARTGEDGALVWRLDATSPGLAAGPVQFAEPRLRVEGRGGPAAFSADMRVTAESPYGPIDVGGEIIRGEGWQVNGIAGAAGPADLSGSARFGDADAEGRLVASGSLPDGGPVSLTLTLGGAETLQIDARLLAEGWRNGEVELDRLEARLQGPLDRLALTATARGSYGYEWRINADGTITNEEDGFQADVTSTGDVGPYTLSSTEPVRLRNVEAGQHLSAAWSLGPMSLSFDSVFGDAADTVSVRFADMPAELLSQVRGRSLTEGSVSGELSYRRAASGLTGAAWVEAADIYPANGNPEQAITARLEAAMPGDVFTATFEAGGADLAATADLQIETGVIANWGEIRDRSSAPVSGSARLTGPVGTLARFYLPESQTLTGIINAEAVVSGTVGGPEFAGDIGFSGGTFTDIRQGVHIVDVAASGTFSGDGATLDSVTATDGDRGTLSGSGAISFADARPDGEFNVEFRNFSAVDKRTLSVMATGDARFEISETGVHVTGEARLDEVEARPPEGGRDPIVEIEVTEINRPDSLAPAPQRRTSPFTLDYHVTAPGRVYIRGPSFDSEWSLDIQARGPLTALKLIGVADLQRGSASLIGRPFDLQSGQVRFDGGVDEATVQIRAQRETEGLTAIVEVSGPMTAPRIALTSRPQLPDDEVLSRVLFGRSVSELSTLEAAQLAAALSSAATGGGGFDAFDRLRNLTGVDRLSIRTGASGAPIVTGGRYIDEDVYLEIEAGTGADMTTAARIEWELRPDLRLLSRVTGTADASIALRWRKEFD
ncbi:translocation/assembly module TamB domain-containing protein [Hyphobacterium marinum]|uniref:Translocation/assembly module TamB domain-containing protein n=1 Tax=Hyphobacterium marinum TaxID=3116574 RepID=A0ABU7M1N3_9PROT|nr:translocation/assembly module TamB domain-containing protein [Hyphobacterium sp. Y6023]MEE2567680.1 translocation/assembly module TamB domain-containing protein [Hyphobacterium sp. Y6023]